MKKTSKKSNGLFVCGCILLIISVIFTILVMNYDVGPGIMGTTIGFHTLNQAVFSVLGTSDFWYSITQVFGIIAILVIACFAIVGIVEAVQRKSLLKVDKSIIALGVFYVVVLILYVFFEVFVINYRPIPMENGLEASFPSSHTMLISCVMVTAMYQFHRLIKNKVLRYCSYAVAITITALTIIGRLLSGVHWFTDILAGILISATLIVFYYAVALKLDGE